MQTPTIQVHGNRRYTALVTQTSRPSHSYVYGASNPLLRPVIR